MDAGGFEFRERSMLFRGQLVSTDYGRDGKTWLVCALDSVSHFRIEGTRLHTATRYRPPRRSISARR